jgi:hypothetical protein
MLHRLLFSLLVACAIPLTAQDALTPTALQQLLAARLQAAGEQSVVVGRDGWLFLTNELRHCTVGPFWGEAAVAVSRASKPEWANPMPAIVDLARQLQERQVTLILVPVPPKALIYGDLLAPTGTPPLAAEPRSDPIHAAFYAKLREAAPNLHLLDLTPAFLAARATDPEPLYCQQDSHFSPRAAELIAKQVAVVLKDAPWLAEQPKTPLFTAKRELEFNGDLTKMAGAPTLPAEHRQARLVGRAADASEPLLPDPASPVLLLGDSHALVFNAGGDMLGRGAGLADQLAADLGFPVEVVAVRGSGATPARLAMYRKAAGDPAWLASKKVVVWCFAAREFTEASGWRVLPIAPAKP